ncbi:MAG TPA: hypothetical protein VJA66_07945 [Thermoanaerobaculia bacterium]
MVAKKGSTVKDRKLHIKKETIKNLDAGKKAKDVKGGMAPRRPPATQYECPTSPYRC